MVARSKTCASQRWGTPYGVRTLIQFVAGSSNCALVPPTLQRRRSIAFSLGVTAMAGCVAHCDSTAPERDDGQDQDRSRKISNVMPKARTQSALQSRQAI